MTRRSKVWLVVAVLFSLANLAGAVFAAAQGEPIHSGVHVGLLLLGACLAWWLAPGPYPRGLPRELTDRLTHLEQSVDAVAIEIERIGEGQRFMIKARGDRVGHPAERSPAD
jgi:hypothetical protein